MRTSLFRKVEESLKTDPEADSVFISSCKFDEEEGFASVLFQILLHFQDILVTLNNLILRLVGLKTFHPVSVQ